MASRLKHARHAGLATYIMVVLLLLIAPATVRAEPPGNHVNITFTATPSRPVAGTETALNIRLSDSKQQTAASAAVAVVAEKLGSGSAAGHAGMNHGGSQPASPALRTAAKESANKGEYVATLKIPEEGPWRIMVTAGDTTAHLDVVAVKAQASGSSTALKTVIPAPRVQRSSIKPAPMENIHAAYLDLAANISDLRTRVAEWQKGNEDSLKIAEEKMARMDAILSSVTWPKEMGTSVGKIAAAYGPMAKALQSRNVAAADAAAKTMGDASHDFTHEFYPEWLPSLQGTSFSIMAPHAIYTDLNSNINDLSSRVEAWQKGDDSSLNIAKEKVERIGILLPHMASTGVALRTLDRINLSMPAIAAALDNKEIEAAQRALKPIFDASQALNQDIYSWMSVTSGASNAACIQASYLDLSANISALRTRVGEWQKGDQVSVNLAEERLDRADAVLAHAAWPAAMSPAIGKTDAAMAAMASALGARDLTSALKASEALGDASHDITDAYYGDWLPFAQLDKTGDQILGIQSQSVVGSGGHGGHGAGAEGETPNYWFVGSMVGMVALTIGLVPVLRRRDLAARRVEGK